MFLPMLGRKKRGVDQKTSANNTQENISLEYEITSGHAPEGLKVGASLGGGGLNSFSLEVSKRKSKKKHFTKMTIKLSRTYGKL